MDHIKGTHSPLPDASLCTASCTDAVLLQGDCIERMRDIPDRSVSLILTDPPYHATKKKNIYGDTFFREDADYLEWMRQVADEWARVLKYSGSVYCFCSPRMASKLEAVFSEKFNVLTQIAWTKPNDPGFDGWKQKMDKSSLREWYPHTERIIFLEPAAEGNLFRMPFGNYLREKRLQSGLSMNALTEITGAYGKVNHGGAQANWEAGRNVPSHEQYAKIADAILATGKVDEMMPYEDLIRPFNNCGEDPFTDVWEFPNIRPYRGKHPAEKPIPLLEHAILASSNPGEIVLDCFAGSGSTAVAALQNGRRSISIEIEDRWCRQIEGIIEDWADNGAAQGVSNYSTPLARSFKEKRLF